MSLRALFTLLLLALVTKTAIAAEEQFTPEELDYLEENGNYVASKFEQTASTQRGPKVPRSSRVKMLPPEGKRQRQKSATIDELQTRKAETRVLEIRNAASALLENYLNLQENNVTDFRILRAESPESNPVDSIEEQIDSLLEAIIATKFDIERLMRFLDLPSCDRAAIDNILMHFPRLSQS